MKQIRLVPGRSDESVKMIMKMNKTQYSLQLLIILHEQKKPANEVGEWLIIKILDQQHFPTTTIISFSAGILSYKLALATRLLAIGLTVVAGGCLFSEVINHMGSTSIFNIGSYVSDGALSRLMCSHARVIRNNISISNNPVAVYY